MAIQDRCAWMSDDETEQCVYYAGHVEPLHRMALSTEPWPPAYFEVFEEKSDEKLNRSGIVDDLLNGLGTGEAKQDSEKG